VEEQPGASAEEQQPGDDSIADLENEEDVADDQGDESFALEEQGESHGELNEAEAGPEEQGTDVEDEADGHDDDKKSSHPDVEASLDQSLDQQLYKDHIAAQVRDAVFMVFDSIDPEQPDDIFIKSAADVICKIDCSGTPATFVGVALEADNCDLRFISLAEKTSEDSVDTESDTDRVLPPSSGVLHSCLSQNSIVAIPNVLDEPSVHFFTGVPPRRYIGCHAIR
jgi:hypothetical protein